MARQPRQICSTGVYHIVFRGVNNRKLFKEEADFEKLIELLETVKAVLSLNVYAYCLTGDQVHLLLKEKTAGDVISAMRRLLTPYAYWFNRKYQRSGTLIANRYKSECIESDEHLLAIMCYIHRFPLISGVTKDIGKYQWSSYRDYTKSRSALTDTALVFELLSDNPTKAINKFIAFHETLEDKDYSMSDKTKKSDERIKNEILEALGGLEFDALRALSNHERDTILAYLRIQGFSIRQIEKVTGISRGVVARCLGKSA